MRIILLVITLAILLSGIVGAASGATNLLDFGLITSPLALITALAYFYLENQRQGVNGQDKRT